MPDFYLNRWVDYFHEITHPFVVSPAIPVCSNIDEGGCQNITATNWAQCMKWYYQMIPRTYPLGYLNREHSTPGKASVCFLGDSIFQQGKTCCMAVMCTLITTTAISAINCSAHLIAEKNDMIFYTLWTLFCYCF